MTLVSLTFVIFLIVMLVLYYLLPKKWQWVILLFGSVAFYMLSGTPYTIIYVILSVGSIYTGTYLFERFEKKKKLIYIVTLLINVGMLAALKYTNFVLGNVYTVASFVAGLFGHGDALSEITFKVQWIASLGISFYALQMCGYLTDCYWGISERQKNVFKLALFNIYFPQMISGPINKYNDMSPTLFGEHEFKVDRITVGAFRILQGFFKKLIVSEQLSALTDYLYLNYENYDGIFVIIGTALYVLQIYADFSGCMDIVTGASECFGVSIAENFKVPFTSETIQEFWQRWHITLGAWLKDYVMYPLLRSKAWGKMTKMVKNKWGKKAAKMLPTFLAMLILWLCMGLWHGGGWNYLGEGVWFWLLIVLGQVFEKQLKAINTRLNIKTESKAWHNIRCIRTGCIYAVGGLFFKAESLGAAFKMLGSVLNPVKLFSSAARLPEALGLLDSTLGTNRLLWSALSVLLGFIVMIILGNMERDGKRLCEVLAGKGYYTKLITVCFVLMIILLLGAYGPGYSSSEFIYGGF